MLPTTSVITLFGLLLLAACASPSKPAGTAPDPTTSPTSQALNVPLATTPTVSPTEASTAPADPTHTPAPTTTATPSKTPSPSPTLTPTLPPGVSEVTQDGLITFTSTVLGITFSYRPVQFDAAVRTYVSGDKVYVYYTDQAADGQYVQVFRKAPGDSLMQAIQKQILQGYDPNNCLVRKLSIPDDQYVPPNTYVFGMILTPVLPTVSASDDDIATHSAQVQKCPQPFTMFNGAAYFMEDTRHPDRFFFFKIGQYWIYSNGPSEYGDPWQDTLRVIDATK
jgi:hypothetical protein